MARLPSISKYCVVCRVAALAFGFVPRVHHAHALDGVLLDPVDRIGRWNTDRFEDGRHDVDDMRELATDAAQVIDVTTPGHDHALSRAAKVSRHLLHPLEGRVHRPRP